MKSIKKRAIRKVLAVIGALAFTLAPVATSFAAMLIKPANLDHLTIQAPDSVRAGETITIEVQTFDAFNNPINNYAETGKDIRIKITGSSEPSSISLPASSFKAGSAVFSIVDKKAEEIVITLTETGASSPIAKKDIRILPNKAERFVIDSPKTVIAGKPFDVKITALDTYGNVARDENLSFAKDVRLSAVGKTDFKVTSQTEFIDGVASAVLVSEKTGKVYVEVRDASRSIKSQSEEITIIPASLKQFVIAAPQNAEAGTPFEVTVTAIDIFDNLAVNYDSYGGGVGIQSTGTAPVTPSYIKPSEFKDGKAVVKLVYEKSEDIAIRAIENNRTEEGKSQTLRVSPAELDLLIISTPDEGVAGQSFRIRIEAKDRFSNTIKDYNLTGADVSLRPSGRGALTPSVVSASQFVEGVATVDIAYDRAEPLTINATLASVGKTVPRSIERTRPEPAKRAPVKAPVREKAVKKPEPAIAIEKQVIEEQPAPEEKPKKEKKAKKEKKPVVKKAEKPKPEPKTEPKKADAKPAPATLAAPLAPAASVVKEPKPAPVAPAPAEKPTAEVAIKKAPVKETKPAQAETKKTAKKEKKESAPAETKKVQKNGEKKEPIVLAKKEEPTVRTDGKKVFSVIDINVIEAQNKALFVITVPELSGILEIKEGLETSGGKDWIKIRVKPAVNKIKKPLIFKSNYIGDVKVADAPDGDGIDILFELLPSKVRYEIKRAEDTIIISITPL